MMDIQEYCERYLEKHPRNNMDRTYGVVNVYGESEGNIRFYGNVHDSSGKADAMSAEIPPLYRIRIKLR